MGLFNINRWDYPENSRPYLPSDSLYAYVSTVGKFVLNDCKSG